MFRYDRVNGISDCSETVEYDENNPTTTIEHALTKIPNNIILSEEPCFERKKRAAAYYLILSISNTAKMQYHR